MNGVTQSSVTEDVSLITFIKVPNDLKIISGIFDAVSEAGINIDMVSQTAPQGYSAQHRFPFCYCTRLRCCWL